MVIDEKIIHNSPLEVRLYKEGVFWTAYEQSAFMISKIRNFKVTKKFVKKIKQEVISIGFPDSILEQIISHFEVKERKGTLVILESNNPFDSVTYQNWKDSIDLHKVKITKVKEQEQHKCPSVEGRVLSFDLGNSTPLQCFIFLNELQQSIIRENNGLL